MVRVTFLGLSFLIFEMGGCYLGREKPSSENTDVPSVSLPSLYTFLLPAAAPPGQPLPASMGPPFVTHPLSSSVATPSPVACSSQL